MEDFEERVSGVTKAAGLRVLCFGKAREDGNYGVVAEEDYRVMRGAINRDDRRGFYSRFLPLTEEEKMIFRKYIS